MNDIVDQLRGFSNCIRDDIEAKFVQDAADEIQRLRKRNNYLREELNATDYCKRELSEETDRLRKSLDARASVISAATDAINHLQDLITEWADAEEGYFDIGTEEGQRKVDRLDAAEDALRKAVGR